ncbi:hypothetical protein [Clostridium tetani]|nr:hypothetical protein [Clostridium tetani]
MKLYEISEGKSDVNEFIGEIERDIKDVIAQEKLKLQEKVKIKKNDKEYK